MTRRDALLLLALPGMGGRGPLPVLAGSDRAAFLAWFTWLAEATYYMLPGVLPREVHDCSGLLRFAFREALREHTAEWAHSLNLPDFAPLPELRNPIRKPDVFLTAGGVRREFADAENLLRYNCHVVSRDIAAAAHGDLLFYRQWSTAQSWHSMVFLRRSAFEAGRGHCLVYHTGPQGGRGGEVRRPTLAELLAHPEPRWRPLAANSNFLGVYRWNILERTD
jgi:uncharacterized protein YfaT (DUF1175 family)